MEEAVDLAKRELKRADHLIFVSLKYTRTVDVIKNIIARLMTTIDFGFEALLRKAIGERKLDVLPSLPRIRVDEMRRLYNDNPAMMSYIDFYMLLKRIDKANFERGMEYRRHVTMTADLDGKKIEITIDIISDYFKKTTEFVNMVENIVLGRNEFGELIEEK